MFKNQNYQKGNVLLALVFVMILLMGVVGWAKNLVALFHAGPIATWAGMEIARVIGVIVPVLGAVLGYF